MNPTSAAPDIESAFSALLRERTGYELSEIDREASFLELGFDSLFLIQLSQQIKQRFGVKLSFRQLIEELSSTDALLAYLQQHGQVGNGKPAASPPPAPALESESESKPESKPQQAAAANNGHAAVSAESAAESPADESAGVPPLADHGVTAPPHRNGSLTGIEQIILQQNALMRQHLALLQGQASSAAAEFPVSLDVGDRTNEDEPAGSVAGEPIRPAARPPAIPAVAATGNRERFGPYKPVRRGPGNALTAQQSEHLRGLTERFTRRTAGSRQHAQQHRDHFADPRGVAGYRRIWKSMVYQIVVERSQGAHLWDIDGNRYVDIAMGFGVNLFGQSPPFITEALHRQLDRGVEVGPQSPLAGDVAALLCDFARKDRATFCNTGSEAVMAAMRLARTVTGKSKVVYFNKDYHGNFDQVLVRSSRIGDRRVSTPAAPGVPQAYADNMIVLDYGTQEALQTIAARADEIAAVLIEPVQSADPFLQPRAFLHAVRRLTRQHDIAMIMDEVITGFRAAPGGAQQWFDVWADMCTYGKILGGGLPIGALAGSRRYMDALDGGTWRYEDDSEPAADMTFFAGTFVRHPLALVAAHQVLSKLKEEGPELQQELTARTTQLTQSLNGFFEAEQFPIRVAQFASQFRFMFPPDLEYADLLYFHLLDRGVFTRGWGDNCFLSTAHSDQDVRQVIDAVQASCRELRQGGFFPHATDEKKKLPLTPPSNRPASVCGDESSVCGDEPRICRGEDDDKREGPEDCTLAEIQTAGERIPLFCAPAADGLTLVYHELADHLGDDQPVYGLNSPGVYGLPLADTLEAFAAGMVKQIRRVQPRGPYLLVGYCSGGTVALEIAQQLIRSGEEVALLGMIETYNWRTAPSTNPSVWTRLGYGYQRVDFHLRNFWLLDRQHKRYFLRSKWQTARRRTRVWRDRMLRWFSRRGPRPQGTVNMAEIWKKHDQLCEAYDPQPYPGHILQFRPRRDYRCHLGDELPVGGTVEYHRLSAYPAGIMVEPFVEELAQQLQRAIDRLSINDREERWRPATCCPTFASMPPIPRPRTHPQR
ncbi:aminotransferase class III-fold pyridoxal phosphate-dependent enzyme [Roseimaritima sediminicola]|uniref:aminotransferase class III-fold pyridoxal phosphate-dependent enzyme n=1 Tax=Roseimaritima sediminicola TaxID=2662066 RepID=UPI0012982973|nr:aminotransferase class III-fold pyridoxal phosphate-dependent enzyme [Roseimaritima sediminicola]